MKEKSDVNKIVSLATERGIIVQPQPAGYLLKIPLFKETAGEKDAAEEQTRKNRPFSYLPYSVENISEIKTVADRLWKNENYKRMVQKSQTASKCRNTTPSRKRQG